VRRRGPGSAGLARAAAAPVLAPVFTLALTLVLAVGLAGCSGCSGDAETPTDANVDAPDDAATDRRTFDQCDGDAASFARQSFLALTGRRPRGQAEVDAYADLYRQAALQGRDAPDLVARAIMNRPEFAERWIDFVMDALHVQRLDIQTEVDCWGEALRTTATPALAAGVRDKPALQSADGAAFTMLDLARSAIALDDLTPIYRGQLFSLASHPIPAANVGIVEAELARRADFGATFDASYTHRDTVCLGCHNSESAVTDADDPTFDRHWPVPGNPEKAVYGQATGVVAERAHAVFRVRDLLNNTSGATRPWGWTAQCGAWNAPGGIADDPAGIDAKLGSISGLRATVFDLDAALQRGFGALRTSGAPTAAIADPDAALAWLVTLKITEDVWRQATGTQLTIANYFPRNQAASELLHALARRFVASGFSLKALLVAIVSSDYWNRIAPDGSCGEAPYSYPNVFDPWVTSDADPARRKNGPGDAVTSVDGRTLITAAAGALEWPAPPLAPRFPDYGEPSCASNTCAQLQSKCNVGSCCTTYQAACVMNGLLPSEELPFERGVGLFLRNSERGFRGLDFQARLSWEDRYGACTRPRWVAQDFVDRLAAAGAATPAATARDAVAALKDRVIGEPEIEPGPEAAALAALVGDLAGPASGVSADALRRVCGALLGSPQFLLQGIAGRGGPRPLLTPTTASYDAVCAELATGGIGTPGLVVTCADGKLALAAGRAAPAPPPAATGPAAPPTVRAPVRRSPPAPDPRRIPAPY